MTRKCLLLVGGVLLVIVCMAGTASAQCNNAFVSVKAKVITVLPGATPLDTANLQCAFDLGAAMGPGVTVQLAAGTFYTEQLVVKNLQGRIIGMGQSATTIRNPAHPLPIDRNCGEGNPCFADTPPSPINRYPSLVSVLGTDVTISDLSLAITGGYGTVRWYFWDFNIELASNVLQVIGSDSQVTLERATIDAGGTFTFDGDVFGGDAAGPVCIWTFSRPWFLTNVKATVTDSTLLYGSLLAYNLDKSQVIALRSKFVGYGSGVAVSDVKNSSVLVEGNELGEGDMCVYLWEGNIGNGIANSSLWFGNNVGGGFWAYDGTFVNVKCEALNNTFVGTTIDPYSFHNNVCKVVGKR